MHEIRRLNKLVLHEAAVKELAERKQKARQRREEKAHQQAATTQQVYYDRFLSSDGEDNSIDSIDSLDMNR